MIRWIVAGALALWAGAAWADRHDIVMEDGRVYTIDLPDRPEGAPLIVALHGGGGNPAQFARNSRLAKPALAEGYAVIWPQGTAPRGRFYTWNAGYCCGGAMRRGVDDLGFLDRVVADATARFGLDGGRLYLTGMSNGAILAETYAAARPGRVRAVAGVSGTMQASQRVQGPVPLLHIHGTADTQVPYGGGRGTSGLSGTEFSSVEAVIAAFRQPVRSRLSQDARVIDAEEDGTRVVQTDWTDPKGRVMIRLLAVEGGGHVWPGGRRAALGTGHQGLATQDIDANAEILHFFGMHP